MSTEMTTHAYMVVISSVDVLLRVSTVSATILQLQRWDELWRRLLSGSAAPVAAGTTLIVVSAAPGDTGDTPASRA
jgi:hypothetical protein